MLSTPHLLAGAAIGSTVGGPGTAFAFGLLSHLLLDMVPHADSDLLDVPGPGGIRPVDYFPVALDIVLGAVSVAYFAFSQNHISENVMAGALGAITPDMVSLVPFWSPTLIKIPVFKQLHQLHMWLGYKNTGKRQGMLFGVLTQFVVLILAVTILMRQ